MAKTGKVRKSNSQCLRSNPYPLSSCIKRAVKEGHKKGKCSKAQEKKDWKDATCSVCLEFPHNAVLLLCSSYHKGCRPYMCATSRRFSNCLDQYKKAYTKVTSINNGSANNSRVILGSEEADEKPEVPELLCPLCRGQVKGWTVVEAARKYLNQKRRSCMQEKCSFVGTYRELKKHVKTTHPLACPRAVDPVLEEKWKKLEHEREWNDVISILISSTPGAMVSGDFVIEPGYDVYSDENDSDENDSDDSLDDGYFHLESSNQGQSRNIPYHYSFDDHGFGTQHMVLSVSPHRPSQNIQTLRAAPVRRLPRIRGRSQG
ncbi:hypothetical protein SLEP1_g11519 [Rubroshorea leprosula]|uniref:Uncharacterized protein n=1 Tax=Rubroshorea leprosula TaxID=152421 RepID=A0AAV5ILE9_9ROSI|nr:hypothetical protein SLEP1_g11519 [Rubroshorea leprosula]